jgi:hypothetical protein
MDSFERYSVHTSEGTLTGVAGKSLQCVRLKTYCHPVKFGKFNVRPSDHTMVLGPTRPLVGVVGKGGRCVKFKTLPHPGKSGKRNFEEPRDRPVL